MKINEIINELQSNKIHGFQIFKRNGILTSTWLIYKKDSFFYFFDINQRIEFLDIYKYSKNEIIQELDGFAYSIELAIS